MSECECECECVSVCLPYSLFLGCFPPTVVSSHSCVSSLPGAVQFFHCALKVLFKTLERTDRPKQFPSTQINIDIMFPMMHYNNGMPHPCSPLTVFYDWINTKIKSITQLSKPLLKEQNNGSDLHHYKHMSTSHFFRNNTHK